MNVNDCKRCNTPLSATETFCRRCGLAVASTLRPPARAVLKLRQVAPTAATEAWEVVDAPLQIGRVDSAIRLPDRTVSRRHARITPGPGGFLVEDLGSSGGTYVNDRQITAPTEVRDGDRLAFGDVVLTAEVREPVPLGSAALALPAGPALTVDYTSSAARRAVSPVRAGHSVSLVDPTVSDVDAAPASGSGPLEQFDEIGGLRTLQSLLSELQQVRPGRVTLAEAGAILDRLPLVCRFLEIERSLVDLARSRRAAT